MVDFSELERLGLDRREVQERFGGKESFFIKCMTIYFNTNNIERLEELCAAGNWDEALECVHTMKGSVGNLAFMPLFDIYCGMTEAFRDGMPQKAAEMLPGAVELERELRAAAGYNGAE